MAEECEVRVGGFAENGMDMTVGEKKLKGAICLLLQPLIYLLTAARSPTYPLVPISRRADTSIIHLSIIVIISSIFILFSIGFMAEVSHL